MKNFKDFRNEYVVKKLKNVHEALIGNVPGDDGDKPATAQQIKFL